jgi:hypothetical protein
MAYGAPLFVGDVVSARRDLSLKEGALAPEGRYGVVQGDWGGDAARPVPVRFPVIHEGRRRLLTADFARVDIALQHRSEAVLRDPEHLKLSSNEEEWALLQKDELVSLGARLKRTAIVAEPHLFAGQVVPARLYCRIVQCVETNREVIYVVNATLPDPDSIYGYRFTNIEVTRDQFQVVDPARAEGFQRVKLGPARSRV